MRLCGSNLCFGLQTIYDSSGRSCIYGCFHRPGDEQNAHRGREAAQLGKGQPSPATVDWEGWPDGPAHPPSVSTDLSVVTLTGAASREKGTSSQGSKPSTVPPSVQAAERPGSRDAALPSATKSQGKVNCSPLCGTGSVGPGPPPHVTAQSLPSSALLLPPLHREVWQHPDSGARAGSACSLAPITLIPPHLASSITSGLLLYPQGFHGVEHLLGIHQLSAKLERSGTTSFGIQSDGERGCKAQPVSMQGTCGFGLLL